MYIAIYELTAAQSGVKKGTLLTTELFTYSHTSEFPKDVQSLSPNFCEIYRQAEIAEANRLHHVVGPAYRKALEFLIKDFLITTKYSGQVDKQDEIRKIFLGKAISDHIDEEVIKQCAKRAAWLGNDETHYVRKWEHKDISDLKALIGITVTFIDMSIQAARYLAEMTE